MSRGVGGHYEVRWGGQSSPGESLQIVTLRSTLQAYYGNYNFYTMTWKIAHSCKHSREREKCALSWFKISFMKDDVDLLHFIKVIKF